jgi:error-prone DNA polymerase
VNGLRQEIGRSIAAGSRPPSGWGAGALVRDPGLAESIRVEYDAVGDRCPKCGCDDHSMLEETPAHGYFCNICAHEWGVCEPGSPAADPASRTADPGPRYASIDDLIARTGVRRDELATLAEIGALNAFGLDRRSALWQVERAVRRTGALFDTTRTSTSGSHAAPDAGERGESDRSAHRMRQPFEPVDDGRSPASGAAPRGTDPESPLRAMTVPERLMADYAGTSLTIGPHPLALRRAELALRGVLRASDLPRARHGRRVRVAGAVITRQRPGTAKGFVFLTLEDETGIANIIVRPDLFSEQRATIVGEPYLLVEGTLQIQEGVTSVKAERLHSLGGKAPQLDSHDFR